MGFLTTFVGLALVASSSAYYLLDDDDPKANVVWPTDYHFTAEAIDVVNGHVATYEIWNSGEYNRSRVDYFGGTQKKYYVPETEDYFARVYVLSTRTDKDLHNSVVCEEKVSDDESTDFLPDLTGFEHKEEVYIDGKTVHVWVSEDIVAGKYKKQDYLYVYRTEHDFDVPLQNVVKSYEIEKGDLDSYVIINYKSFSYTVSYDDVAVDNVTECSYQGVLGHNFKSDIRHLEPHIPGDLDVAFRSYKRHHNRDYEGDEHELRKMIFEKNWRLVNDHNSKNLGSRLELNHFADYTDEEFMMMTGTRPSDPDAVGTIPFPHSLEELSLIEEELPQTFDMRLDGYMRPVRSQGHCGSCWAFTTAAVVEGTLSRSNGGRNLDLSEQSLVDCAWGYENEGCSGGQLNRALQYLVEKGIPREYEYGPYLQMNGVCHLGNMTEIFKVKGFSMVTADNPIALKAALYKYGPVAVAIHAGSKMKLYSNGIFYDFDCDTDDAVVNHGVVVVGYGVRDGTPYWIIRNSWGEKWGEDGYILLSAINNNCRTLESPYYVTV